MLQPVLSLSSPRSFVVTQSRDIAFSHDSSHPRPNELLRARELLRYYTPPSPPKTSVSAAEPISPLVLEPAAPLIDLDEEPIGRDKGVMKSSYDPALKAFSQLLALKLDCERSMISLIDRTNQCAFRSVFNRIKY